MRKIQPGKGREAPDIKQWQADELMLAAAAPPRVVLVACVSKKATEAKRAKDLYVSSLFIKARAYAERQADAWYILSAAHGLLDPEKVVEPYNVALGGSRKTVRTAWANRVASEIWATVPPKSTLIFLAGANYRSELIPLLCDRYKIEIPMRGLGIGQQLKYLKEVNKGRKND